MNTYLGRILLSLCIFCCASARGADPVVKVRGVPPSVAVEAGKVAVVTVELDIRSPYHINSNQPLEEYLIPTSLKLEPVSDLEIKNIFFPVAAIKKLDVSDSPMALYEGTVKIDVEIIPAESLKGGDVVLRGNVRYQACDDVTCLPPVNEPFSVKFSVSSAIPERTELDPQGEESSGFSPERPETSSVPVAQVGSDSGNAGPWNFDRESFPLMLLLVFAGGLALNLTPCVYPMIPITITYFGGQAQGKKGSLIAHAGLYVIGMAVTYSLLGVIAALTGGLLGAALQYPPVLIGISVVMVFLALSMFDVFELRMPAFLNRLAGGNRKGFAGTFLMGLTVGIVAAPCIGPFVFGLLTYVGNRGSAFWGFLLFFVLALGLGLPLLILGIFSGSIHKLPRSGEWMVWIRKVFGFILLAMAVFFLRTLFPTPLIYPLALALVLALAGVYLAWITPVAGAGKGFNWLRNLVGIGFFIAALAAAVTGLHSYMEATIGNDVRMTPAGSDLSAGSSIDWIPFSEQMLDRASLDGKPVLIDFYADWCIPCLELEQSTFTDQEVIDATREFVRLKVDLTHFDSPEAEALRQKFSIAGVPTIVFLDADGAEVGSARVIGYLSPEKFLERVHMVTAEP